MPQIDQLPYILSSQLFWLVVIFGIILFGIAGTMLPKIQSVVDERALSIAKDLELATAARADAEAAEAQWQTRLETARIEAAQIAMKAKQAGAQESEALLKEALASIDQRTELALQGIRSAVAAARVEMDNATAEAVREMVERLVGIDVGTAAAAEALDARMAPSRSAAQGPADEQNADDTAAGAGRTREWQKAS
jgi:F-type H+-transporting ATPase subunit b